MRNWYPAEATIEIAGKMVNIKAPSKVQLRGGLNHLCHDRLKTFVQGASKIKPIEYIVDVGANIGATALMFHQAFPEARILALEPVTMNWDCLVHNVKDIPQITCLKLAAGREKGQVTLALPSDAQRPDLDVDLSGNSGLFSVFGGGSMQEQADMDQLDNLVNDKVDFLKIDVEGAEGEVFSGAKRIVVKDRPIMFVELRATNMAMARHTLEDFDAYFKTVKYASIGKYLDDYIMLPIELPHAEWSRVASNIDERRKRVTCES